VHPRQPELGASASARSANGCRDPRSPGAGLICVSIPERYRFADDLRRPLAEVVAMAEQEAITTLVRQR